MSVPVVSVIMAAYNAAPTLPVAVESMLAQTMQSFEFIIVDDASTDQTALILQHYAQTDRRIQIYTNPTNLGTACSINRAIRTARATYVARMDADDYSFPDRLRWQVAFMNEHPEVDALGTGTELVDPAGHFIGTLTLPVDHEQIVRQRYLRPLLINASVLFRRDFFSRFGYYNERLPRVEDLDLWLHARTTATYHNLPDILFRYTYRPRISLRTFYYDMYVRLRHMHASGELIGKGHELLLYALRFVKVSLID